jgi:hypothetical protein
VRAENLSNFQVEAFAFVCTHCVNALVYLLCNMQMKPEEIAVYCVVAVGFVLFWGPSPSYIAWKTGAVHYPINQVMKFGADEIMFWTSLGLWPWDKTTVANLGSLKEMSVYADAVARTFYNDTAFLEAQFKDIPRNATREYFLEIVDRVNSASYGNMAYLALYAPPKYGAVAEAVLRCYLVACRWSYDGCRAPLLDTSRIFMQDELEEG